MPALLLPPFMHNKGNYTLSLGNFCRWLAGQAEELGVEIFPGFAGRRDAVQRRRLGEGRRDRRHGRRARRHAPPDYQPGMELHARYTFFAEGARGHLTKRLTAHLRPAQGKSDRRSMALVSRSYGTFLRKSISPAE